MTAAWVRTAIIAALLQLPASPTAEAGPSVEPSATGQLTLTARTLTATGLTCSVPEQGRGREQGQGLGSCRADLLRLERARLLQDGRLCIVAARLTVRGPLRLRAEWVTGRVLGLLPVAFSTAAVPPLPLPVVHLTDVTATGLSLSSARVHGDHMTISAAHTCS
ncbi:hypothetical protein [Streptomyces sp. NPDC087294]|uniref:hypothetical protein n=1 Tax=Streptomyces sp. NPDC087294 TaxID=3365777 RepID=UPI0037FA038B